MKVAEKRRSKVNVASCPVCPQIHAFFPRFTGNKIAGATRAGSPAAQGRQGQRPAPLGRREGEEMGSFGESSLGEQSVVFSAGSVGSSWFEMGSLDSSGRSFWRRAYAIRIRAWEYPFALTLSIRGGWSPKLRAAGRRKHSDYFGEIAVTEVGSGM